MNPANNVRVAQTPLAGKLCCFDDAAGAVVAYECASEWER